MTIGVALQGCEGFKRGPGLGSDTYQIYCRLHMQLMHVLHVWSVFRKGMYTGAHIIPLWGLQHAIIPRGGVTVSVPERYVSDGGTLL